MNRNTVEQAQQNIQERQFPRIKKMVTLAMHHILHGYMISIAEQE